MAPLGPSARSPTPKPCPRPISSAHPVTRRPVGSRSTCHTQAQDGRSQATRRNGSLISGMAPAATSVAGKKDPPSAPGPPARRSVPCQRTENRLQRGH